jgi:molybdopterin-guanine dinucleotide biosynthesis protein B
MAQEAIAARLPSLGSELRSVERGVGQVLRQDIFPRGNRHFGIQATQAAGAPPLELVSPDGAVEVMTGIAGSRLMTMNHARVLGIAGWSGSGKTTLIVRLVPLLVARGLRIATLKHAHHNFDVDQPGKDSYEHRKAGAGEVIISSSRRWAQMHELGDGPELGLPQLLRRVSPCDLILVEGFKTERHLKLEVFREAVGKSPLYREDSHIVAIASDRSVPDARIPVVDLNDVAAVANLVIERAEALEAVLARLDQT